MTSGDGLPSEPKSATPGELVSPSGPESVKRVDTYEARVATAWQGPLPPPDLLREYNTAFPGCAERIVAMAEAESRERHAANQHECESQRLIVEGDVFSQKVGLLLAFILAMFVISIGAFLLYTGHLVWGAEIVGFPLLALVSLLSMESVSNLLSFARSNE